MEGLFPIRLPLLSFLLFILCLLAGGNPWTGHAQEKAPQEDEGGLPSERVQVDVAFSPVAAARRLYEEGLFASAREFLHEATPVSDEEVIEKRLLLALIALEEGAPRSAAESLESILSDHPELVRVRLELARAYYIIGDDEKSRFHFSYVLGAERLPRGVENTVEAFLNSIQARKRWSGEFSVAVLPQSNVNQGTERENLHVGALTLRLNEEAQRNSGVGLQLSGGGAWQPVLGGDWRGRLALSGRLRHYGNSRWNDVILASDAGVTRLFDGGSAGGGVRLQRRWVADRGYRWQRGLWAGWQQIFLRRNWIDMNIELFHLDYDQRDNGDGWSIRLSPDFHRSTSARRQVRLKLDLQRVFAREGHESSRLLGVSGGITHGFSGGLVAVADIGMQVQHYRSNHPLFARKRRDVFGFASLRLLYREFRLHGFAPYVEYRYERNHSNIGFFSYDNHIGNIGITRQF